MATVSCLHLGIPNPEGVHLGRCAQPRDLLALPRSRVPWTAIASTPTQMPQQQGAKHRCRVGARDQQHPAGPARGPGRTTCLSSSEDQFERESAATWVSRLAWGPGATSCSTGI